MAIEMMSRDNTDGPPSRRPQERRCLVGAYNEIAYAADVGARKIVLKNSITDANLKTAIRDAFRVGNSDLLVITSDAGSDFRTIDISYPFDLLTPTRSGHHIRLHLSRQIPLAHPLT